MLVSFSWSEYRLCACEVGNRLRTAEEQYKCNIEKTVEMSTEVARQRTDNDTTEKFSM
jgi:hypothetical protein